jgi:hypothetical protein
VDVRNPERLAASLRDYRVEAALYRRLATLRTDVPLGESLAGLEWRGAPRSELEAVCLEIGYAELLERVPRWRA